MLKKKCNPFLILLAVEAAFVLILLAGCFRKEEMVDAFFGEDISKLLTPVDEHAEFSGKRMILTPGVYQIRVWTELADGESMYVDMQYDNAYFKALRNNGMSFVAGQEYEDFEVYVLDKVQSAYVHCSFSGNDAGVLTRLEVWKTSMGSRMLLFIASVFFAMLDFLVLFRRRILEGKVTAKQQVVFWTLTAGVLLSCFPYMTNYFISGYDSTFHLSRIAFLADALKQNARLPIRVEGTWIYGHGYMSSTFYGDLFLFIPALLRLIGFCIMDAYKIFLFLVNAATALIAYHSFRKCVKEEYAALFGSMIYLLAHYRLGNAYGRGALGEVLGMTFLPLVCCGIYLLYTEDTGTKEYKKWKWYVIWGMTAILQSHLISAEIMAVCMVFFAAAFWKRTFRKQTFLQLLEAAGIALLINAWFWLPLVYMMNCDVYHMQELGERDMQASGMLLGDIFGLLPGRYHEFEERQNVCKGAAAAILLPAYALWRTRKKKKEIGCDVCAVFCLLSLAASTAYFPWNSIMKIPGIGHVAASFQFPWRWLSPAALFLSLFAAFFFRRAKEEGGLSVKVTLGVAAVITVASAVYYLGDIIYKAPPFFLYNEENMGTTRVVSGEYLLEETEIPDVYYHGPVAEEGLIWSECEKLGTNVSLLLDNRTNEIRYLEIPLFGYKGYGVKASESETEPPFISQERGNHGDLRLAVPAGYQGSIQISYEGLALFHVAEAVSVMGLAAILGVWLWGQRRREK